MKKTSYAIIIGIAALFILGLGITAYMASHAEPLESVSESVMTE